MSTTLALSNPPDPPFTKLPMSHNLELETGTGRGKGIWVPQEGQEGFSNVTAGRALSFRDLSVGEAAARQRRECGEAQLPRR